MGILPYISLLSAFHCFNTSSENNVEDYTLLLDGNGSINQSIYLVTQKQHKSRTEISKTQSKNVTRALGLRQIKTCDNKCPNYKTQIQ